MSGNFEHGLFSCFDNCTLCICTFFCPCYVAGKVAETVGDSCCLHGAMVVVCPLVSLFLQCYTRGKIRDQKGIAGSQCNDFCISYWCMPCALCQEAQEMNVLDKSMAEEQQIDRA